MVPQHWKLGFQKDREGVREEGQQHLKGAAHHLRAEAEGEDRRPRAGHPIREQGHRLLLARASHVWSQSGIMSQAKSNNMTLDDTGVSFVVSYCDLLTGLWADAEYVLPTCREAE